jgi:hypothetical protein
MTTATAIEPVIVYEQDDRQKLFTRADELVTWLGSEFQTVSDDRSLEHQRAGVNREEILTRIDSLLGALKGAIAEGQPKISPALRSEAVALIAAFHTVHPPTGKLP